MLGRIAVHLDNDAQCEQRTHFAATLAAQHNCELVGIYSTFHLHQPALDEIVFPPEFHAILERTVSDERRKVQALFNHEVAAAGVDAFWRTHRAAPQDILELESRYADLLIMSQPLGESTDPARISSFAGGVILSTGRPVMMLPNAAFNEPVGKHVLVCWDQGREAARALADAGPIIEEATALTILTVDSRSVAEALTDQNRDDLKAYCAFHGFPVPRIIEHPTGKASIAEAIVNAGIDAGADLIVMGAYGHSRLQQAILGGTTRKMLEIMRTPVLFSH